MKSLLAPLIVFFALSGCTVPVVMGGDAAVIALSRPSTPDGPDIKDQIPEHASWCYQTMGEAQCFAHPQDVPPDRLVNVDPPSLYPIDVAAYRKALVPPQTVVVEATAQPVLLEPPPSVEVEKAILQDEIAPSTPANPRQPNL